MKKRKGDVAKKDWIPKTISFTFAVDLMVDPDIDIENALSGIDVKFSTSNKKVEIGEVDMTDWAVVGDPEFGFEPMSESDDGIRKFIKEVGKGKAKDALSTLKGIIEEKQRKRAREAR